MTTKRPTKKAPAEAGAYNRFERVREWAVSKDHEWLANRFAYLLCSALSDRQIHRLKMENARLETEVAGHAVVDATAKWIARGAVFSRHRMNAGDARWANDPKQDAKAGALELWKDRHAGKHPELRTVGQFATEVMRRWPELTSATNIEAWSAAWTRHVKEGIEPHMDTKRTRRAS